MEGFLKVTPKELTDLAENFNKELSTTKSNAEDMFSLINAIGEGVWTGTAATSYKNQFGKLHNDFDEVAKMINDFITKINEIAKKYEDTEKKNNTIATGLKIDPII